MVLSNAERQRRFREKRNQLAAVGITADMIDQVAMLIWEASRRDDPSLKSWEELLASTSTKRGLEAWREYMEDVGRYPLNEADAQDRFGEDAELVLRVTQVLHAAFVPPSDRRAFQPDCRP